MGINKYEIAVYLHFLMPILISSKEILEELELSRAHTPRALQLL